MKELELTIGQFASFLESQNIELKENEFVDIPFKVEIPDENDNWIETKQFIRKT